MSVIIKWQSVSFISKMAAVAVGFVTNIVVLRILTPEEWGVIGLAVSVVGGVAILQNLGLATGLQREIAQEEWEENIPTIIFTSLLVRLMISSVVATTLFLLADRIAHRIYGKPEIIFPIKLLAVLVLFNGAQDIFSTAVGALREYKWLFSFQAVLAVISLFAYSGLVYLYRVNGYFYANYVYSLVSLVLFGTVVVRYFRQRNLSFFHFKTPLVRLYFRGLMSIGVVAFAQKTISVYWQKLPTLVMGTFTPVAPLGIFNFAQTLSEKLKIISDASTDVSIPEFLRSFHQDFEKFTQQFTRNFTVVGVVTMIAIVLGNLFFSEFLTVFGLRKYADAQTVFFLLSPAFLFYAFLNVLGVIFVASDLKKHLVVASVLMFLFTGGAIYPLAQKWGIKGGAVALSLGSGVGSIYYLGTIWYVFGIKLINKRNLYLFTPLFLLSFTASNFWVKISATIIFATIYWRLVRQHHYKLYRSVGEKITTHIQSLLSLGNRRKDK